MNIKPFLRNAWNEPRRFFFYLALFCSASFAVFCFATYLPRFSDSPPLPTILLWLAFLLMVGIVVGVAGFFLAWIPPVHRFFVWLLRRRFFALACVVTLVALFYAEENWRGKHAWENYKRAGELKGERFDYKTIAPPSVPDDQNFAMMPIWVESVSAQMGAEKAKTWYGTKVAALGHTNFVSALSMPIELQGQGLDFTNKSRSWLKGEKSDLKLWQDYYRKLAAVTNFFSVASQPQTPAEDVLLALSKYDSTIEALRQASTLPYARFPLGYTDDNPAGILLPHLSSLKGCCQTLVLRASAELQAGQSEKALDDINLMLHLTEAIRNEPILISHLVRIAMLQIALQPVWEGLAEHKWSDTQLAALDAELAKLDFLADYSFSMRGERTWGLGIIDYLQRHRNEIQNMGDFESNDSSAEPNDNTINKILTPLIDYFIPSGWFEQNKLAIAQMHERYLFPIVNLETRTVSPTSSKRAADACTGIKLTPYNWFTRFLLPSLNGMSAKSARAQWSTDVARFACALERYRLANKSFPETLDALVPQFMEKIPHDIINGKSLHYRRTDDGQFVLYSVGWNETDDGGLVVMTGKKTSYVDIKKGDWVWKYPAK